MQAIKKEIPIWEKYSLTIQEASDYFCIGEKKMRELISNNPNEDFFFNNGTKVLIKRIKFENYIDNTTVV